MLLVALLTSGALHACAADAPPRPPAAERWLEGGFTEQAPPASRRPFASAKTVLFVNFDGVTLTDKPYSDATKNYSSIGVGGTIPPFAGDANKVFDQVVKFFAPFGIDVVRQRPASGDYLMAAVGGDQTHLGVGGSWVWGLAPVSCDYQNPRGVAVIFSARIAQKNVSGQPYEYTVASTTAHEVAHLLGMVHVVDACDLLSITRHIDCKNGHSFRDAALPLVGAPYQTCNRSSQNSFQLLGQRLGLKPASDGSAIDAGLPDSSIAADTAAAVDLPLAADSAPVDTISPADDWYRPLDSARSDAASASGESGGCAIGAPATSGSLPETPVTLLALCLLGLAIRRARRR